MLVSRGEGADDRAAAERQEQIVGPQFAERADRREQVARLVARVELPPRYDRVEEVEYGRSVGDGRRADFDPSPPPRRAPHRVSVRGEIPACRVVARQAGL